MNSIWPFVFVCSCVGLAFLLFIKVKWLSNILRVIIVNSIIGLVLVYLMNSTGIVDGLYVPINYGTLAVVGLLGIPGVALLIALQLFL